MNFNTTDTAFAFVMLACGFLYCNLIQLYMLGAGVTIFAGVVLTVSFVYLSKSGFKQNLKSRICLTLTALSAIQFALFDNQLISSLNFMFLTITFVYWICLSTGREIDKKLSVYIIGDAIKQGICIPFLNFGCCWGGVKKGISTQEKGKGILAALIGILIFFPLIAIVINLLTSADLAFEYFMIRFYEIISIDRVISYIIQFIFGIPVAFYLYGLIYGDVKGRHKEVVTSLSVDSAAKNIRIAPKMTIYSALMAFNLIYFLFFAVQTGYLFSAFQGNLPEAFSYAEYARRGFFELCAVAGINLGVLTTAHLFVKREEGEEPKLLKASTLAISLFTILLIATALSKMILYINVYGLTQLRVYTSWFMILLLFIFVIICARQFKKFNSAKAVIIGFIVMFVTLSYSNVDGHIVKYNFDRYQNGTLEMLDIEAISKLSAAAVPYLYEMYQATDGNDYYRQTLAHYIKYSGTYGESGFRGFNVQKSRADEIRNRLFVHD